MARTKRIKTGGRTLGTVNKVTAQMQDLLKTTFEQYHAKQLQPDLMAADPETRLRFMLEVAKLITPKPPTIAGFDFQERSVFTGINLDVENRSFPIQITRRIINDSDKGAE